ncbi:MAG: quinone-dependent dihydroorotate dehydrogenase [SAR324 cluster bacterium]|nr:quinone-dependent dihydroorotate dehydrogenase [SAR324 cluster bacterium]
MSSFYNLIRPVLFQLDPEQAHHKTVHSLKNYCALPGAQWTLNHVFGYEHSALKCKLGSLELDNPIGLAAGFDKDAQVYNPLFVLGYGSVEVGTVTPKPQPGNPKPRLFRLVEDEGVINRMGFNNEGVEAMIARIRQNPPQRCLGINIGKNKDTPLDQAIEDYKIAMKTAYPYANYIAVNISSPNTQNLRTLQEKSSLARLLSELMELRVTMQRPLKPIFVKIAPDLEQRDLMDIIQVVKELSLDGVIATNTTLSRNQLKSSSHTQEQGGLSGRPVQKKSTDIIKILYQHLGPDIPIIGVGGIFTAEDAYEKIKAGATIVQIYTGMIYQGPGIVKQIKQGLVKCLENDGFSSITQAIGIEA